eukprot:SAG31_NODE_1845_length_7104_cov_2.447680_7_plen_89_part_00
MNISLEHYSSVHIIAKVVTFMLSQARATGVLSLNMDSASAKLRMSMAKPVRAEQRRQMQQIQVVEQVAVDHAGRQLFGPYCKFGWHLQ